MTESAPRQGYDGKLVDIDAGAVKLRGVLNIPQSARGTVVLPWGLDNGSQGASHRNFASLARPFHQNSLTTLLVDLFTQDEGALDALSGYFRNNTDIMQQRLNGTADWLLKSAETQNLAVGLFGTGTVGVAALLAAVERPDAINALVTVGAQLEAVRNAITRVSCPTLLIASRVDQIARELFQTLPLAEGRKRFESLNADPPLLSNQGALQQIATLAGSWFARWLVPIQ